MKSTISEYFENLKGKTVSLIGFGVSHRPVADLFLSHGVSVVVHDKKTPEQMSDVLKEYEGKDIKFVLGENYLDGVSGDVVFRTPGMRPDNKVYVDAKKRGSRITSEMEEFFRLCPCKIAAVTGSDGKTTSTTLICKMLEKAGYTCHLGGNIGKPLLPEIEKIKENDFAVIELSSFQLSSFIPSPDIAVVTNVAPNHLDWHTGMDEYIEAKEHIFINQKPDARLVLNYNNDITRGFAKKAKANICFFSLTDKVENGTYLATNGDIIHSEKGKEETVMNRSLIRIPGDHNVDNYMTAISAVWGLCPVEKIRDIAEHFGGVEHRMEFVREYNGVSYYNDSIGTSPTRSIACLKSQSEPIVMIAGGYDKKIPYEPLAPYLAEKVKVLILMGKTAPKIKAALLNCDKYSPEKTKIIEVETMEDAVKAAVENSKKGDRVYLSPASASFDLYPNFEARGKHFKNIVNSL